MQKKKIILLVAFLCLIVVVVAAFYLYQKPRNSLVTTPPAYVLTAKDLYAAFSQDEKKANQKYVGKVLQVFGTVADVEVTDSTSSILLSGDENMGGVNCSLLINVKDQQNFPVKGAIVNVKGRCTGFIMDVDLVDAVILK